MTLLQDLRTLLLSLSAVTDLVGSGSAARIRPGNLSEDDNEASIVLNIERLSRENDLEAEAGLVTADVAIDCYSKDVIEAWNLAEAVRTNNADPGTGLAGFDGTAGGTQIDASYKQDDQHESIFLLDGSDEVWHVVTARYLIQFNETV